MKTFDELSPRQRKILRYIDSYIADHNYPPTIREIGEATNTKSTSVVNYNLNKLVEEGYIEREERKSRGLRLIAPIPGGKTFERSRRANVRTLNKTDAIPLIGDIAAGEPIPVPENIGQHIDEDDFIEVTPMMLGGLDPSEVFALRVQGESMIDAMISDGDIVLIRHQLMVYNGEMAAVWLRDRNETTLKHFYLEGDRIRLQPAHPYMDPIYVQAKDCQVQGKVLSVIRRVK